MKNTKFLVELTNTENERQNSLRGHWNPTKDTMLALIPVIYQDKVPITYVEQYKKSRHHQNK